MPGGPIIAELLDAKAAGVDQVAYALMCVAEQLDELGQAVIMAQDHGAIANAIRVLADATAER